MEQAGARILGIETSCDETAAAVVLRHPGGTGAILSNVVRSQIEEHQAFGGVVPEIAARAHVQWLDRIVEKALREAGVTLGETEAIAATAGPGLIGGLLVGLTFAKAIAAATGKPLIAVNHLEAHALTARLTEGIGFPYLVLLVSGGHSQFVLVEGLGRYDVLGTTVDDALGEAFDKVAKLLSLGFPGGPEVEKSASRGNAKRFAFPRPMLREPGLDFSFSGLKTSVRLAAETLVPLTEEDIADISAGFQAAVVDVVASRTGAALEKFGEDFPGAPKVLVVAGGVAANKAIASGLAVVAGAHGARLIVPPPELCGDNAAMVAWAGAERLAAGALNGPAFEARARWPLDGPEMRVGG
ncbi:MAG: tRNA (adenosine(37)-N6)-threonylcarbamoyltransferase complex transferase subunit TsaD [Cucumibacter sp.]